jgi:hypothetical protein
MLVGGKISTLSYARQAMTSRKFQCTLDVASSTATLEGNIDENADLAQAVSPLSGPRIHLDLAGIRRINSPGVRNWIVMIRSLSGREIVLRRCSSAIVDQLSWLREFRGHAIVESLMIPVTCEQCDDILYLECNAAVLKQLGQLPAPPKCIKCGMQRIFDDLPERFLNIATLE